METSCTKITKNKAQIPLVFIFSLALCILSAYCLVLPFTEEIRVPLNLAFYFAGGLGFAYFAFMSFDQAYQFFRPKNAVVLSDDGFLDLINGGVGAGFVPWSNVQSVEIRGGANRPYIGVSLSDANEVIKTAGKALEKQIDARTGANKPELLYRPFEIGVRLEDALEAFKNHRNAYLRTLDHGDTNVLFGGVFPAVKTGKAPDPATDPDPAPEKIITPGENDPPSPHTKSIDELLAELSESIGKSRSKLQGGETAAEAELRRFIEKMRDKQDETEKPGTP